MNRSVSGHNNVLTLAPALVLNKDEADKIAVAIHSALEKTKL
jgi:taurine-pyruvate aminotransferase